LPIIKTKQQLVEEHQKGMENKRLLRANLILNKGGSAKQSEASK